MVAGTKMMDRHRLKRDQSPFPSIAPYQFLPQHWLTDLYIARGYPAVEAPHEGFLLASPQTTLSSHPPSLSIFSVITLVQNKWPLVKVRNCMKWKLSQS